MGDGSKVIQVQSTINVQSTAKENINNNSKSPLISIIIRTYNNATFIVKAVQSTLNQVVFSDLTYEIIVINDGSTDQTKVLLSSFENKNLKDNQSLTIINQENQGAIQSGHIGLSLARGKYVIFLDGDDEFTASTLQDLYQVLQKNPTAGFAYADYIEVDLRNKSQKIVSTSNILNTLACGILFTKSILLEKGFWDKNFIFPEYDLLFRLQQEFPGIHVPKPLYIYNRHPASYTANAEIVQKGKQQLEHKYGPLLDFKKY